MEDIKITSVIDLKTYYRISLLLYFKLRLLIYPVIVLGLVQYSVLTAPTFDWQYELLATGAIVFVYLLLMPASIYLGCKRNMKKTAYLREDIHYFINAEKIEYKGETVSASSNWQYITKLIEREKCFLLMITARSFHYLPKASFESTEEIARLKNLVKEKGIKTAYH